MRTKLRPDWYCFTADDRFSYHLSGIYEWRIESVGIYIGKAKTLRRRIRDYPNNVRRMIDGLPWHGNPLKKYRYVHHALRQAHDEELVVSVRILENCSPEDSASREQHWIRKRRQEAIEEGPRVLNSD